MKAQINLRSTFRNTTRLQRGSAALTALVLAALIGTLLIYIARPSAQSIPTARVSVPAHRGNNVPVIGTGSAYDGGHYVDTPAPTLPVSPNLSKIGTGSVYDGGHYVDWQPVKRVSPTALDFGTGSVYDGGHYVDWQPVKRVSPTALDFGTGSVYDGGHYVDTPAPTLRVSPNLSKIGTGSVYDGGN